MQVMPIASPGDTRSPGCGAAETIPITAVAGVLTPATPAGSAFRTKTHGSEYCGASLITTRLYPRKRDRRTRAAITTFVSHPLDRSVVAITGRRLSANRPAVVCAGGSGSKHRSNWPPLQPRRQLGSRRCRDKPDPARV